VLIREQISVGRMPADVECGHRRPTGFRNKRDRDRAPSGAMRHGKPIIPCGLSNLMASGIIREGRTQPLHARRDLLLAFENTVRRTGSDQPASA
jgi:hypothetical protein